MVRRSLLLCASLVALLVGCGPRTIGSNAAKPNGACNHKVDILEPDSSALRLSYRELGERTVTCNGFAISECEALLKEWACALGADATIVVVDQSVSPSKSSYGRVRRLGRAIRFNSTPGAAGGL